TSLAAAALQCSIPEGFHCAHVDRMSVNTDGQTSVRATVPRAARGREAPALMRPNRPAISPRQDDSCIAVGTCVSHAPAQNRTGGFPAYGLYGSFFVKDASCHFCRALLLHSFVRPAPRAFFRFDRILRSPSRTATIKGGACSAPPKACP